MSSWWTTWSDIGPFGSEITTPNLDALARRGVQFTQFYATPRCSPTRASLLAALDDFRPWLIREAA